MDYSVLKKKYFGLDVLRIVAAFMVCMFHTTIHLGCDYGILQGMSKMGAVFITAFFMLSGFSLFANWSGKTFNNMSDVSNFWKKRIINIIPMYFFTALVYDIIHIVYEGKAVLKNILLLPIEILGLQSVFSSLFSFSHNGGTWFISCIMICYLFYPYLQEITKSISGKVKLYLLIILSGILLYSPIICKVFDTAPIYSNPFFRGIEFFIGMLLAAIKVDYKDSKLLKLISNWLSIVIICIAMCIGVSVFVKLGIAVGNYMMYSCICLPCFALLLLSLTSVESKKMNDLVFIKKLSAISYVFFLAQLFSNDICKLLIIRFQVDSNIIKILLGWSVCIAVALFLRAAELWLNKLVSLKIKYQ